MGSVNIETKTPRGNSGGAHVTKIGTANNFSFDLRLTYTWPFAGQQDDSFGVVEGAGLAPLSQFDSFRFFDSSSPVEEYPDCWESSFLQSMWSHP